jgi:hypothetical protein
VRYVPLSGLGFVALDAVALFLPGPPPRASDSAPDIAHALATHRSAILASMFVAGLAVVALVAFLGSVGAWVERTRADHGLAITAIAGASLGMAAQLVGMLLVYGAAFQVAGRHEYAIVRALTDGGNAGIEMSKFGFAAFIAGVCLAGHHVLRPVFFRAGLVAALALVVSAIPLFSEGRLTEFGGGVDIAGGLPGVVWIAVLSWMLARSAALSHGESGS